MGSLLGGSKNISKINCLCAQKIRLSFVKLVMRLAQSKCLMFLLIDVWEVDVQLLKIICKENSHIPVSNHWDKLNKSIFSILLWGALMYKWMNCLFPLSVKYLSICKTMFHSLAFTFKVEVESVKSVWNYLQI